MAMIQACYVDHGIRPRASVRRDIKALQAQAQAARAKVIVRRVRPASIKGSPEERARRARYRALVHAARACGASHLITGHQQDDLTETSLLALARGSGIDGVAAMRPLRALHDDIVLARPLLWATKAECAALLAQMGLPAAQDETNDDRSIPRNAVRALIGALEQAMPGSSRAMARSMVLLADDRALLDGLSKAAWRSACREDAARLSASVLRAMPLSLVRRVIRRAVAASGASLRNFHYEHCNAIAEAIKRKRGGRYHAGSASVVLSSGALTVQASPEHVEPFAPITVDLRSLPRAIALPSGRAHLRIRSSAPRKTRTQVQHVDLAALEAAGAIQLRLPRTGDRCMPTGRSRQVSLARFLAKAGVMRTDRDREVLLSAGGRIAAVLGLRVMEPFKPKKGAKVLEVALSTADI